MRSKTKATIIIYVIGLPKLKVHPNAGLTLGRITLLSFGSK